MIKSRFLIFYINKKYCQIIWKIVKFLRGAIYPVGTQGRQKIDDFFLLFILQTR